MNAIEMFFGKFGFHAFEALPDKIVLTSNMDFDIIVISLNP